MGRGTEASEGVSHERDIAKMSIILFFPKRKKAIVWHKPAPCSRQERIASYFKHIVIHHA